LTGQGKHHFLYSNGMAGGFEWWVQEPGIILYRDFGDVDTLAGHFTNPLLNGVDVLLGGSLSGAAQCVGATGCALAGSWLWTNLALNADVAGGLRGAGITLTRGVATLALRGGALSGQFARAGLSGIELAIEEGATVTVSKDGVLLGEHAADAEAVTLQGENALSFVRSLGCPLCFPAGTLVATPKGKIAIEKLHVGDTVLAEDPKAGTVEAEPVQALIVRAVSPLIAVDLGDGSTIRVQPDHPFWVDHTGRRMGAGWLPAGELAVGDTIRTAGGKDVTVTAVHWNVGDAVVYTLTVAHDHTYFVGSARVLVHNANGPCILRIELGALPADEQAAIRDSLTYIRNGTVPSDIRHTRWGSAFRNEPLRNGGTSIPELPFSVDPNYYHEYRVLTPGSTAAGARRLVIGGQGEVFYTTTHYGESGSPSFIRLNF
jgi:hypothetical protein